MDAANLEQRYGLTEIRTPREVAELAYDLARPRWGRGYMSQAVGACVDWVFGLPEFERVDAYVRVDNRRSERVLERAGRQAGRRNEGRMECWDNG